MRFVEDQHEIIREVVQESIRGGPRAASVNVPRVVFDAGAAANVPHHLNVIGGAHLKALGFEQLVLVAELRQARLKFGLNTRDGPRHAFGAGNVMRGRKHVGRFG